MANYLSLYETLEFFAIYFDVGQTDRIVNKYVRSRNIQTEMYADRVACCSLVSHVEYAPRAPLRLEKRRDRQTDGQTDTRPLHYVYR